MIRIAALIAVAFALQDKSYEFDKGTVWTYDYATAFGNGKAQDTRIRTMTVSDVTGGKMTIDIEDRDPKTKKVTASSQQLLWQDDGYLLLADVVKDKPTSGMRLLKIGAKKGESWGAWGDKDVLTMTHEGTKSLKVLGKDVNCLKIVRTDKTDTIVKSRDIFYVAPGYGLVQIDCEEAGVTSLLVTPLKLTAFKKP